MKPIEVEICLGTTCFVMGSGYLQELEGVLPNEFGDKVKVSFIRCLGMCSKSDEFSKAPFVKVGGDIVSEATYEKIVETLRKKIEND